MSDRVKFLCILIIVGVIIYWVNFFLSGVKNKVNGMDNTRAYNNKAQTVFTRECFPRYLSERGITLECFSRANLGDNSACSASQLQVIRNYYESDYNSDIYRGSEAFCAK